MGVMHPCHYPGCMKKFDRKYNLKCHLRIHSNEKPYRCHHENCTRSFRWKSSLNHHLMSLDHTPASVRRARKARAQRRRIARTSPHTYIPQQPLNHQHHPAFDLPALSPVSSVATFSHTPSPQQRTLPDISHPQPHQFKLDHRINPAPDVSSVYSHTLPQYNRPPSSHVLRPAPKLHTHPEPHLKPHPQHSIIPHLQDPLAIPVKPLQNPLILESTAKTELRIFAEDSSHPKSASEPETSVHTSVDDTISLVTPTKKSDPVDFNSSTSKVPMPPPLVSIFEEFSPVSLMPFSSSLDSLFPANVDTSGMKSF